jgi:hypothetical protein
VIQERKYALSMGWFQIQLRHQGGSLHTQPLHSKEVGITRIAIAAHRQYFQDITRRHPNGKYEDVFFACFPAADNDAEKCALLA